MGRSRGARGGVQHRERAQVSRGMERRPGAPDPRSRRAMLTRGVMSTRGVLTRGMGMALAALLLGVAIAAPAIAKAPPGEGRVLLEQLDGAVTPVSAEALIAAIDRAEHENYRALVIQIDTPGGLESSMRAIVKRMLASKVPIITWVAPGGARAASAGVFITMAGDVAAMAPGTNIGAATPVNLQGGMDSTMAHKVTNDAAAFARTVAAQRGRNQDWAEKAVRRAEAVSEDQAAELHVVDFIASDMAQLLERAD